MTTTQNDIPKYSIVDYLETKNVYVDGTTGRRKVKCPWHDDRNPSASVDLDNERFHCFTCDASGDVLDLIQHEEGCDFESAIRKAQDLLGDSNRRVRKAAPSKQVSSRFRVLG